MKPFAKEIVLLLSFLLVCAIYAAPSVRAAPDPVEVSWFVTNIAGEEINGAELTIYWATSTSGPFERMPADDTATNTYILDKVNGATAKPPGPEIRHNPIISGYWNPTYFAGMAICDLHPSQGLEGLYFFVTIEYDTVTDYWPVETSYKPFDTSWKPVQANTLSGYAAAGPGIGRGPTGAYPTGPKPPPVIPEVPFGTIVSFLSMFTVLAGFVGVRRFRPKSH